MKQIVKTDIASEEELGKVIVKVSKNNPKKYITYFVTFGENWGEFKTWIFVHDRKPQSVNSHGAENTYRHHGGFFRNGKIVKPSNTFVKQFNRCPVLG